jgi:tryptophanyl-tRNA synthetase
MAMVERVFSGVQPTGNLHLGNYLGAIVNFVKLQETHNCLYCVVDMHALTQPVSVWGGPAELARNTREVTAAFIASGIDPKSTSSSTRARCPGMPNWHGSSIAWRGSAGSTA